MLYKIGDFAKITNTSVKTLRFFFFISLLIPERVDVFTGYRYYSDEQIERLKLIQKLKDLGFSLEEIRKNIDNLTDDIFLSKRAEFIDKINDYKGKIKRIDMFRSQLKG